MAADLLESDFALRAKKGFLGSQSNEVTVFGTTQVDYRNLYAAPNEIPACPYVCTMQESVTRLPSTMQFTQSSLLSCVLLLAADEVTHFFFTTVLRKTLDYIQGLLIFSKL
jgi:hypothetical protein